MGWLNPNCPSCGKPMTPFGTWTKDGLKCADCYRRLRKAEKAKKRARRKRGAPERSRTPDDPV